MLYQVGILALSCLGLAAVGSSEPKVSVVPWRERGLDLKPVLYQLQVPV